MKLSNILSGGYSAKIEEVHNAFATASDKLYEEMVGYIGSVKIPNESKVEKLSVLGFVKSKEVVETREKTNKVAMSKAIADTVQYYRQHYPLQKFITKDQVKKLCEKYGLVCGEVSDYTGFVPEQKLNAISSFVLREEDANLVSFKLNNTEGFFSWGDLTPYGREVVNRDTMNYFYITNENGVHHGYSSRLITLECEARFSPTRFVNVEFTSLKDSKMRICAPAKDFDMTGKEIKGVQIVNKPVPDPVVLRPVKDGFLILAAWGDEASDPIVVNEIDN